MKPAFAGMTKKELRNDKTIDSPPKSGTKKPAFAGMTPFGGCARVARVHGCTRCSAYRMLLGTAQLDRASDFESTTNIIE